MAQRLLAWHGGYWHGMAYAVAMAWLTGCRALHCSQVVAMTRRFLASHGMEVVAMTRRLSASYGMKVVAMAWIMLLPWRGV